MRRVLFVDDEPRVLHGLERTLHPMRDEWHMAFVSSGAQALELMAQAPFDVVVADMRMPGMNGAELLNQVMQHYPRTVRLILSGHADSDLILKCVGSTHQYLSKPCDPEMLKATVVRATALDQTLQSETLRRLVAQLERLPSLPALYSELVEKLQSPEVSLEDVGAIVAKDIGMTAKLLKLVNSAFFGLRRQITDALQAVTYLGVDTIKSLVLGVHTFSQFERSAVPEFPLAQLWDHSAHTAVAAKAIAQSEDAEPKQTDEAFSAGLLHDTGKLVLACNLPAQYGTVRRLVEAEGRSWLEAERQVFGATHADVGGYLLGLWGLPVPVVEAIALHHSPARSPNRAFSPLTAVHFGDYLVHEDAPGQPLALESPMDQSYLATLDLEERMPQWRASVRAALARKADVANQL